jgi:hypothetical protein
MVSFLSDAALDALPLGRPNEERMLPVLAQNVLALNNALEPLDRGVQRFTVSQIYRSQSFLLSKKLKHLSVSGLVVSKRAPCILASPR